VSAQPAELSADRSASCTRSGCPHLADVALRRILLRRERHALVLLRRLGATVQAAGHRSELVRGRAWRRAASCLMYRSMAFSPTSQLPANLIAVLQHSQYHQSRCDHRKTPKATSAPGDTSAASPVPLECKYRSELLLTQVLLTPVMKEMYRSLCGRNAVGYPMPRRRWSSEELTCYRTPRTATSCPRSRTTWQAVTRRRRR
jgi:hypothetical protein